MARAAIVAEAVLVAAIRRPPAVQREQNESCESGGRDEQAKGTSEPYESWVVGCSPEGAPSSAKPTRQLANELPTSAARDGEVSREVSAE